MSDDDIEPEEAASHLKVGHHRTDGSVIISRENESTYVAECGFCGWKQEASTANAINWLAYCHNRRRRRIGCEG
jgi:hypothetical protein